VTDEFLQADFLHHTGHARVLGGPGSGKSSLAVAWFRHMKTAGRTPAIVAYTREQQKRLTEQLIRRNTAQFGRVAVATFSQLSSSVLELSDRGRHSPLRDVDELVVLAHAIDTLDGGLRSDYKAIPRSDAFRRSVLGVMHALLQNNVAADAAVDAAARARTDRGADLLRVYAVFRGLLDRHRLVTFYDIAWRAAELLEANDAFHPLPDVDALLIDDAQDIDPGQVRLVESLAPPNGDVGVILLGDPTGSRFAFRGTSAEFFLRRFPAAYRPADFQLEPLTTHFDTLDGTLERLTSDLLETTSDGSSATANNVLAELPLFSATPESRTSDIAVVKRPTSGPVEVESFRAEDPAAEAQAVAVKVRRMLDSGTSPGDVALIARDRHHYENTLVLAFAEAGIAIETGSAGVYAPGTFARSLLGALVAAPDERATETIVSSPLFFPLREALAEKLHLGDWLQVRAVGDLVKIIDYFSGELQERKNDDRVVQRLLEMAVRPAIEHADAAVQEEAFESIAVLSDEWTRYRATVAVLGTRASIGDFLHFYPAGGETGRRDSGRVRFFTVRETVGLSFPVVFLLGCAESVFPRVERTETYIPYREIEGIVEGVAFHESRGRAEQLRDENRLVLTALSRARKQLVISFPESVGGEANPAPPRAFARLFRTEAEAVVRIPGVHSRAARCVAAGRGPATVAPEEASSVEALWLTDRPAAPSFAIDRFPMSPSRLETFSTCERKLFYTRVMGIEEEKSIPLTIGSLFHDLMEKIAKACPSRDELLAISDEHIESLVDDAVRASHDLGPPGSLIETITRNNVTAMIRSTRSLERDRAPGYRIAEVEQSEPFDYEGQQFLGKIDRIDDMNGLRTVIDYKTGKIHKQGKTIMRYARGESKGPRHWQLPFYSQSIKEQEGALPELFCYYVVQPGEEPFAVGLFISDDPDRRKHVERFHKSHQRYFDSVSPNELDRLMKEAAGITAHVFAERPDFPRTEDVDNCRNCYFNRLCERRTHEPQF